MSSLGGIPKLGTAIDAPAYPKGCIHRHHWGHAVADRSPPAVGSVATARRTCKPDRRSIGSASWHGRHVQMGRDGDPSKTNLYDEGITLSPTVDFLTGAIAELRAARMSSPMLFPFTCAQLAEQFKKAAARVGVAHLGATLYGNRHGGASDMRLRGVGLPEIKKRGRWASDTSLRRYEKATVAQQQHLKVPVQTRVYADFVENQLKQLGPMLRRVIRVRRHLHRKFQRALRKEFKSDHCQPRRSGAIRPQIASAAARIGVISSCVDLLPLESLGQASLKHIL